MALENPPISIFVTEQQRKERNTERSDAQQTQCIVLDSNSLAFAFHTRFLAWSMRSRPTFGSHTLTRTQTHEYTLENTFASIYGIAYMCMGMLVHLKRRQEMAIRKL